MSALDPALFETMSAEELARTLQMSPSSLADVAQTIAQNPSNTIDPARSKSDAPGLRALDALGDLYQNSAITRALDLGATIGEGGMGIVRAATQKSLDRQVAVKTIRKEAQSRGAVLRLLREGWVTGSLEHPNIVPVYDLGLDEDGLPLIILKRIEGVEWASVMREPETVRARFGATDLLEYNLRILIQICNAVSLAHARGVIHRDLKPENVMIGRFGEVYLVDWGIAVTTRSDPSGTLLLAREATEMAGTPAYMAPEMLGPSMGKIDERTDVYLLGSVLHEILTGNAPHAADEFRRIVMSIVLSEPKFGADVPRELAAIVQRAMARDPDARFATAEEMRSRLEWYLRHRGSLALSRNAMDRVVALRDLTAPSEETDAGTRERVYRLFSEARFGFRQAMVASEENDDAKRGLREAALLVAQFDLRCGRPEAASAALSEIEDPPAMLTERVGELLRARAEEKRKLVRLEKLDASLDPAIGRRTRLVVAIIAGLHWTVTPGIMAWLERRYADGPYRYAYIAMLIPIAPALLLYLWGRESLRKTTINRRLIATVWAMFAGILALEVGLGLLGIGWVVVSILMLLIFFFAVVSIAIHIDRRVWPSVPVFLTTFLVACAKPEWRWQLMAAANALVMLNLLAAWLSPEEDPEYMWRRLMSHLRSVGDKVRGRAR